MAQDRIVTARPAHLMSEQAEAEVTRTYGGDGGEVSDACALTIASWWQSPGRVGRHLAELSTTGSVGVEDLLTDIHNTYAEASTQDRPALDLLATWALNHPSRA